MWRPLRSRLHRLHRPSVRPLLFALFESQMLFVQTNFELPTNAAVVEDPLVALWTAVRQDSSAFDAWTKLAAAADKQVGSGQGRPNRGFEASNPTPNRGLESPQGRPRIMASIWWQPSRATHASAATLGCLGLLSCAASAGATAKAGVVAR